MPRTHALVEVADGLHPHLAMPLQALLEKALQLILLYFLFQFKRVPFARDTQQHSVLEFLHAKEPYITGTWHKSVVVAVDVAVKLIIACIQVVIGLEQAHLIHSTYPFKDLYCLPGVALDTLERYVALHDAEHTGAHCIDLLFGQRALHTAIIPTGNGILKTHCRAGEQFVHCLHEDERQRTDIHAHTVNRGYIKELDILVAIYAHCKTFGDIIHLCGNDTIWHFQPETIIDFL